MRTHRAVPAVVVGAAVVVAGCRRWRRWWRTTPDECAAVLVGDDEVVEPASQSTLAITIDAPIETVWPWLVQLGADRGGFYSYDWLENLFGLRIHSAKTIVPEWQVLDVGDVVAANRARTGGWYVVRLEPDDTLVLETADLLRGRPARRDEGLRWEFLWTFALVPAGECRCRLLVRERVAFGCTLTRLAMTPLGFVSFVMTRKMMLGIKQRAETAA